MKRFWPALVAYFLVEALGTLACARWLRGEGRGFLAASFVAYVVCSTVWLFGVAGESAPSLARALALYPIVALLSGVFIGVVTSGKGLSAQCWLGVALGIVSILLVATDVSTAE